MRLQKSRFWFMFLVLLMAPKLCRAIDEDSLKVDFLQGNYRRVIFESQAQGDQLNLSGAEELNYILGLSYLQEARLEQARDCFKRVLGSSSGKLKPQAELGLADTYLMSGQFSEAENIYHKLLLEGANSSQRAALLYRLSQLEFKKGNPRQGNDYLFKLRREFPLSLELRLTKGLSLIENRITPIKNAAEYSVQVGFFTNSNNANAFKDKLSAQGYSAYVEEVSAGYRVKVGKLKSYQEALDLEAKLAKEGFQTKIYP